MSLIKQSAESSSMSFSDFIEACKDSDNVNITHAICATKDRIIAEYVKPPYEMNSLRLFFSMTKSILYQRKLYNEK